MDVIGLSKHQLFKKRKELCGKNKGGVNFPL
jgi:hypothetical protein